MSMSISIQGPEPASPRIESHPLSLAPLTTFRSEFLAWCRANSAELAAHTLPHPDYETRVIAARSLQRVLFDAGWSRFGWPTWVGGLGGSALHRGIVFEELSQIGWHGPAIFEHLEIIAPTLLEFGDTDFVAERFPRFLDGTQSWVQGFSEPDAGSDLASLRTRGVIDDGCIVITGQKIWTSWAKWGHTCLALVRTGSTEERHRGLTMVAVDLESPGVDVRPIQQANGTYELAEVFFDEVRAPIDQIIGEINGGWAVAMHLLAHERGTLAWFRHNHFRQRLAQGAEASTPVEDAALGAAIVQLAGLRATAGRQLAVDAAGGSLGPTAAFTKLLMTRLEQQLYDVLLRIHGARMGFGVGNADDQLLHQEYLFSRVVTIYGGSEQMQLMTLANRVLKLGT
jgi:alkylation response protein AidB-like acyl-CoA dehydrogenase